MANTAIKLGVVMDPISTINIKKDSTFAMLLEAQQRRYDIYYFEQSALYVQADQAVARARRLSVRDNPQDWYEFEAAETLPLAQLDVILMRKDPPFNMDYIYTTYILELAQKTGVTIVNDPRALRDANEKMFTLQFPQCISTTLVASQYQQLKTFIAEQRDVIIKPLDGMGGQSIFRIQHDDPNLNVILETMTHKQQRLVMAQRYIPEISAGDKRILLIDGKPIPYALARIPSQGETRANLATGGTGQGVELTQRDRWICEQVGPRLKQMGLMFVGLDVIGEFLTEINVTSPTCIRELDSIYNLNISAKLFDAIERQRQQHAQAVSL